MVYKPTYNWGGPSCRMKKAEIHMKMVFSLWKDGEKTLKLGSWDEIHWKNRGKK